MTNKLSNLKSLDGASVDRTNATDQSHSDIEWRCICQSQIKSTQSLRSAYLSDIKLVNYLNRSHLCLTFVAEIYSRIV